MVDIFSQGKQINSEWAKFEKIGDAAQGTYIGKRKAIDSYNNSQIIYELLQDNGVIVNVGVREAKVKFHQQMETVQLGQIIGVKLTQQLPNQKGNPTNILSIFADPNIRNEEWIARQKEAKEMMTGDGDNVEDHVELGGPDVDPNQPIAVTTPPANGQVQATRVAATPTPGMGQAGPTGMGTAQLPDVPFESAPTDADKTKNIFELAQAKLGVNDPMAIKDAVMEKTGLAFIPSNFDKIIDTLRQL